MDPLFRPDGAEGRLWTGVFLGEEEEEEEDAGVCWTQTELCLFQVNDLTLIGTGESGSERVCLGKIDERDKEK